MSFVHLHNHTEYSLLDGITRIEELPLKCKKYGMPAVAMTDHGTLAGALKFYNACKKAGIKPIIGCEVYFAENRKLAAKDELDESYYHLILLAQNEEGLRNLFRINSQGYYDGFYRKGRIDDDLLREHGSGLIATSACLGGRISQLFLRGSKKAAVRKIHEYKEMFDGRFFLEIQDHDMPEQQELNKFLLEVSHKYDIPPVLTGDCHYLDQSDGQDPRSPHELLLGVQTNRTIYDEKKFSFDGREHWVKTPAELQQAVERHGWPQDVLSNTVAVADLCTGEYFSTEPNHMPSMPGVKDANIELTRKAKWGLVNRFGSVSEVPDPYRSRLDHELNVIQELGYSDYFLMVEDFTSWANSQGIRCGPGRGSVAGSLVAWALKLTSKATDPIQNGLYFERFLNKSRVSPPDVDSDFQASRRDEVKDYIRTKYGNEYTASIGTHGCFYPRSAVRDMARIYGHPMLFVNEIAKLVPDNYRGIPPTIEDCEKESPQLLTNPDYYEIWEKAKRIIGLPRNAGSHAAGVIIATDKPLWDVVPLYRRAASFDMITEFDMKEMEQLGYFKFDFLGLKNLDVVAECLNFIKIRYNKEIDFDEIDYDNSQVFDLLCKGKLCGIFQLEGSLRQITIRVQPRNISELSVINALGRPGPLDAGLVDQYIENKNNGVVYNSTGDLKLQHKLAEILHESCGVMAYQEQVMQIAVIIGGFSLEEADNLRKAIGKKSREAMAKLKDNFVQGGIQKDYNKEAIESLWEDIEKFADYCFNKSHSLAYSVLSYQEAWLKSYYPGEFMAALMSCEDDLNKVSSYIAESKALGVTVLGPSINTSIKGFSFTDTSAIVFGLDSIKGLGKAAVTAILNARRTKAFDSFEGFMARVDGRKLNKRGVEALILAGAFDELGYGRQVLLDNLEHVNKHYQKLASYRNKQIECDQREKEVAINQKRLNKIEDLMSKIPMRVKNKTAKDSTDQDNFNSLKTERTSLRRIRLLKRPEKPELEIISRTKVNMPITLDLLSMEKEVLGYYLSMHPTDFITANNMTTYINEIFNTGTGIINGVILNNKEWKSRSGKMAFLTIEDATGVAEVVVFANQYKYFKTGLPPGQVVRVMYRAEDTSTTPIKLIAEKVRVVQIEDRL